MSREFSFLNGSIAVIAAAGGRIENLTAAFDEDPAIVRWTPGAIFFSASNRTRSFLYSIDPATKAIKKFAPSEEWMGSGFSLTPDAQTVCLHRRRRVDAWRGVHLGNRAPGRRTAQREVGAEAHRHDGTDRRLGEERTGSRFVEKPGRHHHRRSAAQADRIPGGEEVSAAGRHPRRPDRHVAPDRVFRAPAPTRSTSGRRKARSFSSPITAAAPDTARRSARSTSATSASATPGTSCRASTI